MGMQATVTNTSVCDVVLEILFGDLRSYLMCSTKVFTVFMVVGVRENIFHGGGCDRKGGLRC